MPYQISTFEIFLFYFSGILGAGVLTGVHLVFRRDDDCARWSFMGCSGLGSAGIAISWAMCLVGDLI